MIREQQILDIRFVSWMTYHEHSKVLQYSLGALCINSSLTLHFQDALVIFDHNRFIRQLSSKALMENDLTGFCKAMVSMLVQRL